MRAHPKSLRLLPLTLPILLAACSGGTSNPVTLGQTVDTDTSGTATPTTTTVTNAKLSGEVKGITYDAVANQLVIEDLPFDGVDGVYVPMGLALLDGFESYESQETATTGQRKYYAVYRRGTATDVGAVGTGDYADFGFGGASIKRDNANVTLPVGLGETLYTGKYAGVKILAPNVGGRNDVRLIEGDVEIVVDFLDFASTSAVEGTVSNRIQYDINGNQIPVLRPLLDANGDPVLDANDEVILQNRVTLNGISLATAGITDDGFITSSSATTYDQTGIELQSGTYEGLFAGPNGEEVAGVIIIEGKASENPNDKNTMRETGVFTAER